MKRIMVMGDIHGAFNALAQCLERSGFDYENDILIQLGDITDGYPHVYECVEELLKIKNLIAIIGNHDAWFMEFINSDFHPYYWGYGGKGTLISYLKNCCKEGIYFATGSGFKTSLVSKDIPQTHKDFFNNQMLYHIDKKRRCFVHAGFNRYLSFGEQREADYYWDRSLWNQALEHKATSNKKEHFEIATNFREIYIGHSPTTRWGQNKPMKAYNIINMDTGAGHSGRLTILDVDSKEFWQSDSVEELYIEISGHDY
ncbi:metallophosphoesterase [Pedobacter sp. ISL-68]|uniref:metallophosphoesterase n=1 Tax=unclassified Pedobacter TaxID=2628915 RepID=UPI001BEBE0A2|nr:MULTISPECIES: metallophosphoesterase [unclassified Pedobacter]MBT2561284.1 metallophosphoesterase [Pedobacter sp. ISL-64]MBT2590673.1 metallophosphoesterase [Pedobacter sp. ISL-68]